MKQADSDIGRLVGVLSFVFRNSLAVRGIPTAVFKLSLGHPLKSQASFAQKATDYQTHCRLDMIPRIGFIVWTPWDFSTIRLVACNQSGNSININW